MRAYCHPDGVIHMTAGEVPAAAICFVAHDDAQVLKSVISTTAELSPCGRMFVVPGLSGDVPQRDGIELLIKYSRCLKAALELAEVAHAA